MITIAHPELCSGELKSGFLKCTSVWIDTWMINVDIRLHLQLNIFG